MAKMGDWRHNKDEEIELDGIGGVNIVVKADVHRSGAFLLPSAYHVHILTIIQVSTSLVTLSRTKPRLRASPRWRNEPATRL